MRWSFSQSVGRVNRFRLGMPKSKRQSFEGGTPNKTREQWKKNWFFGVYLGGYTTQLYIWGIMGDYNEPW